MMTKLIAYTLGSTLALAVAIKVVPGISYQDPVSWQILALAGLAIALMNLLIAPVLRLLTLPLRILTFNLFSLVIDMAMVWTADILIDELNINGIIPLFWTTVIILIFNALLWKILSPSHKS